MASIVHVTDKEMIEFHRLNGNDTFNFWRTGSKMKFAEFKVGDTLFFLAKGSERKREKGIIGYGKCAQIGSYSFNYMWKKYGTLNGYHTKNKCAEAIVKVSKNHKIPERLTCVELTEVAFFNSPVYLSELNARLSNKLESYTYIDRGDQCLSEKIILKAAEFGVDLWTSKLSEEEFKQKLTKDAFRLSSCHVYEQLSMDESKYVKQLMRQYNEQNNGEFIIGSQSDSIEWSDTPTINIPVLAGDIRKLQLYLGHAVAFRQLLTKINPDYQHTTFCFLSSVVNEEAAAFLQDFQILYKKLPDSTQQLTENDDL